MPVNIEVTGTAYTESDSDDQSGGRYGDFGGGNVNESAADDMTETDYSPVEKDAAQEATQETEYKCGWGFITPTFLQKCLKIEFFLVTCCCLAFAQVSFFLYFKKSFYRLRLNVFKSRVWSWMV